MLAGNAIRNCSVIVVLLWTSALFILGLYASFWEYPSFVIKDSAGLPWLWVLTNENELSVQHWHRVQENASSALQIKELFGIQVRTSTGVVNYSSHFGGKISVKVVNVVMPRWLPLAVSTALLVCPVIVLFRRIRHVIVQRRLRSRLLCVNCSYDLTANVSGSCPECGSKILVEQRELISST